MRRKIFIAVLTIGGLAILFFALLKNSPITLSSSGALPGYSIDDLIKRSELIVIGEVTTTLPSKWMGANGSDPKNSSPEEVASARGLFTDSMISIDQILKGDVVQPIVRVRAFTGKTNKVIWASDSEPSYVVKRTYLLFLVKDIGPTAKIDPGDYIAVGAFQGVYEIVDGKAISKTDEWILEELIAYIQKSLSAEALVPTELPEQTPLPTEMISPTP